MGGAKYFSCSCDNFCSVSNNSLSYYEGHHESQVIFHNKSSTIECSHPWNVFSIEYFSPGHILQLSPDLHFVILVCKLSLKPISTISS